jgi:diguanylate cyclase (GGDEF)-like protein
LNYANRRARPRCWQGLWSDITQHKRLETQLAYQASHDALTHLPNQALFPERLTALLAAPPAGRAAHVLYIDLDDFKTINDSLGHPAGDVLLISVAQRLLGAVRASDLVARLGGDEFAVLMADDAGAYAVHCVVDRI